MKSSLFRRVRPKQKCVAIAAVDTFNDAEVNLYDRMEVAGTLCHISMP